MPLNKEGHKVMSTMMKTYGAKKGKQVFYASENKGKLKGIARHQKKKRGDMIRHAMGA